MNRERPFTVVKLGGSLLRRADWPDLLAAWLARRPAQRCHVMIVGGGEAADAVREADRRDHLGDEVSHWLAIEAMQANLAEASTYFPQSPVCRCLRQLKPLRETASLVWFDPLPLLRQEHTWQGLPPLPRSWDVTSDSIAARVACRLGNTELVLLKSALPPRSGSLADWAEAGYVDAFFPHAATMLAGVTVNLTAPDQPELVWRGAFAGQPTTHR
jgi:aspartokinase-like uncharacterized kinase